MDLTTLTDAELKAELQRREEALAAEEAERNRYIPRAADEYTDAEKIAAFDRLHEMALTEWNNTLEQGYCDDDFDGYAREALLELLAHPGDAEQPPQIVDGRYNLALAPFWVAFGALQE